ncbi:MAG: glutathione S-transferase [Pelagimonas sp.]
MSDLPILWSFRRCPYAMRARLAIMLAGHQVELREIVLRDKSQAFLDTSPSGTVPALRLSDQVLDESLDIMIWTLERSDPDGLLDMPQEGWDLIAANDGPFKAALDHTKYTTRYPELDHTAEREKAVAHLLGLDARLAGQRWLMGDRATLADYAILPFVRQFAFIDKAWFDAQDWPHLNAWLARFLDSGLFASIMSKYAPWAEGDAPLAFGG